MARAKAVIAWNRQSGEIRAGGIPAPAGFEQWLLKFDGVGEDIQLGVGQNYGRTEYAYSLMAKAAGVEMAECVLLEEGGRAHFMTRRFDRPGNSGERFLVPGYRAIVREIEEIVDQWPDFAAEAQLPPERTDAVRARLSEVRL